MGGDHSRCYQTGSDHDSRCRRLDHGSNQKSQDKRLQGIIRHLLQRQLQCAGGAFLQTIAHETHAIKEHGQSAQQ